MFTVRFARLAISLGLAASMLLASPTVPLVIAQDPSDLPGLGDAVLTDQLTTPGTFVPGNCPSKLIDGEFAPHGFQLHVTGVCTEGDLSAGVALTTQGLAYDDGDMVIDVQVTEGYDRAVIGLHARRTQSEFGLSLNWIPALRRLSVRDRPTGPVIIAAEGQSVPDVAAGAWTQLALRVRGDRFWVLMNDQLVLTATHTVASRGGAGLLVGRIGELKDDYPVRVLWRNMRVSALVDGDPARGPTYAMPERPQSPSGPAAGGAPAPPPTSAARIPEGSPSEPGAVVYEESLAERGMLQSFPCPSGKGRSEVTPDGFRLAVSGRCDEARPNVNMLAIFNGLTMPDGELRFEFRVTSGFERAGLTVLTRAQATAEKGASYAWLFVPAPGDAALLANERGKTTESIVGRRDLRERVHADEWHTLAIRHHGEKLWLLLDDAPVLAAEDGRSMTGQVVIAVSRSGGPDDDTEVGVTFRNLRVSRIEGAPDDRVPTVQRPSERPSRPGGNLSQLPGFVWPEQLALVPHVSR